MRHCYRAFMAILIFSSTVLTEEVIFASSDTSTMVARTLVHIEGHDNQHRWKAAALEKAISKILSSQSRLKVVPRNWQASSCVWPNHGCFLNEYRKQGSIDIVILGQAGPEELNFSVYEAWTRSLVRESELDIDAGSSSYLKLKQAVLRASKPITEKGGILDQYQTQHIKTDSADVNSDNASTASTEGGYIGAAVSWLKAIVARYQFAFHFGIFALAIIMFSLPMVLSISLRRGRKKTSQKVRSFKWSALTLMALIAITAVHQWLLEPGSAPQTIDAALGQVSATIDFENLRWLTGLVSGLLWGWLIVFNIKVVFPGLFGIEKVKHWNVVQLLRSWAIVSSLRMFLVVLFYVPVAFLVFLTSLTFGLGTQATWLFLVPACGCLACLWVESLVENLCLIVDEHSVMGPANESNPWHYPIKKYFLGYVKRLGIQFDKELIDKLLFLPSDQNTILVYGSLNSKARIVVSRRVLEFAMGPLSQQVVKADHPALVKDSSCGMILVQGEAVSSSRKSSIASEHVRGQNQIIVKKTAGESIAGEAEAMFSQPTHVENQGDNDSKNLLYGFVIPENLEKSVPLISDNEQDLSVVDDLMTEHHREYIVQKDFGEFDDTDPSDKDFLFGLLLHMVGSSRRNDKFFFSIMYAYKLHRKLVPGFVQKAFQSMASVYQDVFQRYVHTLNDSYTALSRGIHHYIQYLFMLWSGQVSYLTARADRFQMYRLSRGLLKQVRQHVEIDERWKNKDIVKKRLIWLSQYFYNPIHDPKISPLRALMIGSVTVFVFAFTLLQVTQSYNYHFEYQDIIEKEKQIIKEAKNEQQEKNNGK